MQIVTIDISQFSFYCPVTGQPILQRDKEVNLEPKSLLGYWVDLAIDEPSIKDPALMAAWQIFQESNTDEDQDDFELLESFFSSYTGKNHVVFKISNGEDTHAAASETVWFVMDLNPQTDE